MTLITGTTTMMSTKTIMMAPETTKRPVSSFQLQLQAQLQQKLVTYSLSRHHHIFFASEVLRPRRRSMSTIRLLATMPTSLPTSALTPLPMAVLFSPKLANLPKVRCPPLAAPASFAPTKQTKRKPSGVPFLCCGSRGSGGGGGRGDIQHAARTQQP